MPIPWMPSPDQMISGGLTAKAREVRHWPSDAVQAGHGGASFRPNEDCTFVLAGVAGGERCGRDYSRRCGMRGDSPARDELIRRCASSPRSKLHSLPRSESPGPHARLSRHCIVGSTYRPDQLDRARTTGTQPVLSSRDLHRHAARGNAADGPRDFESRNRETPRVDCRWCIAAGRCASRVHRAWGGTAITLISSVSRAD